MIDHEIITTMFWKKNSILYIFQKKLEKSDFGKKPGFFFGKHMTLDPKNILQNSFDDKYLSKILKF